MAKWLTILLIMVGNLVFADTDTINDSQHHSNSSYIILAIVALIAIIFILYRRQKRKFNE